MTIFEACKEINCYIESNEEEKARNKLIILLDHFRRLELKYTPLVNHLIRTVGLFPYLNPETSIWQDRLVYEMFKVDVGDDTPVTLHREQSRLLKKLVDGESLAVSAPTSFGKSFVIDAFITINKPNNVVLIVPTIALTDETRRRLYRKFSDTYKIITTSDVELSSKNIFIFPQERAIHYVNTIKELDILIIDEFYKASSAFDDERAPALISAIIQLGKIAKQKYFLAPNISELKTNPFTKDMEFLRLDFNTVFLNKHELYRSIDDERQKEVFLLKILNKKETKTLIYAGTYSDIQKVSKLISENLKPIEHKLLTDFSSWLIKNYDSNWSLPNLVKTGTGIHNGRLHRSLSQIQIKLFEEKNGLKNIISTSSIIEGVNTSAENVIIWRNRNGRPPLNDFTYKNIIGRGGRMFKHFIGQIYILEKPPAEENVQLDLRFPDELLPAIDEHEYKDDLTPEQIAKIMLDKEEIYSLIGKDIYEMLLKTNAFQTHDLALVRKISLDMVTKGWSWKGLAALNSERPSHWDNVLYKIIRLQPGAWGIEYSKFVAFIKTISNNWTQTIPTILKQLDCYDININIFFELERNMTFKFASLLNDVNVLQKHILPNNHVDISPFISKISHAFMPSIAYQLEEYGLPRIISRKIQSSGVFNFENIDLTIHDTIDNLNQIGQHRLINDTKGLDDFEKYIINYFYDGISATNKSKSLIEE